jgi:hypothetical protein
MLEATAGIEPADEGFADLCLTTWLRRLISSGRRDSECSERHVERQYSPVFLLVSAARQRDPEMDGDESGHH